MPLTVQPQPQASQLFPDGLHDLLSVLFQEEREAYSAAIESAADRSAFHHPDDLTQQTRGPVISLARL